MNLFKKHTHRGFTLVELLIVVAIIALLASIVLANLNKSREKANIANKQETLNSIRTALELYRIDDAKNNGGIGEYPLQDEVEGAGYGILWRDCGAESERNQTTNSNGIVSTSLMQELVDGGYLPQIPSEPSTNNVNSCIFVIISDDVDCGDDQSSGSVDVGLAFTTGDDSVDLPYFYWKGDVYGEDSGLGYPVYCLPKN